MTKAFSRFLMITFMGSCLIPVVTAGASPWYDLLSALAGIGQPLALALTAILVFRRLLARLEPTLDADAREQATFLDTMPLRYVDFAIVAAAGVSLFLELSIIRWQSSVFSFFAFYTNFGLLACFAGLGLGYALASRDRIPLSLVIPLLGWQFALLIGLRSNLPSVHLQLLGSIPIVEQANMGLHLARSVKEGFAIYFFLTTVFLLTAITFVPVGQLCGRLMTRRPHLRAYGLNLLGSLAGVLAMFAASAFWTPPVVWYATSFAAILMLSVWRPAMLARGVAAALVCVAILAWPVSSAWNRIYSPYQMLELGYADNGTMVIRAAGHYYQRVHDFSGPRLTDDSTRSKIRDYYDLPYKVGRRPTDVVVVGAGAGNDVAAALRAGAASVDAVEIDPAILRVGGANHPEHPYADKRVHQVLADARSFLRTTDHTYDLIVYGLLDSHTLLSHASNVRLDSFVYTVEGFRDARARLKPGGRIVLSFSMLSTQLGRKMDEMLRQAFDGAPPVAVTTGYDGAVTFMQSDDGKFALPRGTLNGTGFEATSRYSDRTIRVDASTDDWPFFYMPRRVYPMSYLVMLGMVLLAGLALTANFIKERPTVSESSFFLLGAGFMLVETKAITELGLIFGSTWRVIGIVIAGILLMAFLANVAVQGFNIRRPEPAFLLLLLTLAAGWLVTGRGGLHSSVVGRVAAVALLTSPMLFSGIVFSTLLRGRNVISSVMATNLIGAMCGGLLEYNSMYFGFRFLYILAMCFYAAAFMAWKWSRRTADSQAGADLRTPVGLAAIEPTG